MNAKSMANTALALSAAAETIRYTSRQGWRFPVVAGLWTVHVLSVLLVATRSRHVPLPGPLGKLGLLLATSGGALALYSALGEHTREGRGRSEGAEQYPPLTAVLAFDEDAIEALDQPPSDGTYTAARHPALLGYAAFLAGLVLMTRSVRLLLALPLWLAAAVGQAALREEVLRRSYEWYEGYIHNTPMLIPTAESAQEALDELKERFGFAGTAIEVAEDEDEGVTA